MLHKERYIFLTRHVRSISLSSMLQLTKTPRKRYFIDFIFANHKNAANFQRNQFLVIHEPIPNKRKHVKTVTVYFVISTSYNACWIFSFAKAFCRVVGSLLKLAVT